MKRSLVRQINIGFGITLLLLLLNAIISYRNILKLIDNQRLVSRSHQTIAELEGTLSTLKDAETGQRGYLLTGKDQYLEPYNAAVAQLNQRIQTLQQLATNQSQQQQIEALEQAIATKLVELNQTIQLRRTGRFDAALRVVQTDRGKQLMDNIRSQIAAIERQETNQLQQRAQESQQSFNSTLLTFTLITGTSLLLLGLVAVAFRRIETQQQQAELTFVENITRQKQVEAALRESEQEFKATFEQAAVGIAQVAPNGTWLRVNQRLCEILGYSYEELLARTFQDITHPDDLDIDVNYMRQMLAGEMQTYSMEKRYIRKDGSSVWINLTVALVREADGQPKYFISVVEDIDRRKRLEAERQQAELTLQQLNATLEQRIEERTTQLTEINQELEAFTYSVSHDLRAPLRVMQGFAQALEEDYGDRLDDIAHTYIESISDSAVQMDDLINDLLDYSRLSRTQIHLQPTDLNHVIDVALQQLQSEIAERQAIVQIPSKLPSVIAYRPILIQVVINLISNAIKFVEPATQPLVTVSAQVEKNSVCLSVEDNGIGIAPEYQDRIFRVFERLHGIEAFPGTGIGLAIVRKGIERMGGQVGVESQVGHGSRFWLVLPIASDQTDSTHDSTSHSTD